MAGTVFALEVQAADRPVPAALDLLVENAWAFEWSPDGTSGAFIREGGLWISDASGANAREIVVPFQRDHVFGGVMLGQWSPNGRWISYSGLGAGQYVVRPDGTDSLPVAFGKWTSDAQIGLRGDWVWGRTARTFWPYGTRTVLRTEFHLTLIDRLIRSPKDTRPSDSLLRTLARLPQPFLTLGRRSWSRAVSLRGRTLYLVEGRSPTTAAQKIPYGGTLTRRRLPDPEDQPMIADAEVIAVVEPSHGLTLSPDGEKLAYVPLEHVSQEPCVVVLDVASRIMSRYTLPFRPNGSVSWSRDGRRVAIVADRVVDPQDAAEALMSIEEAR